ncbi:MAG TPA: cysteine--tRNA ligase [Candidatus Bathyarchaeia archaeon]|nr:cysteine--tRNA ligase [Candidatus Bathyarchaeia archaeon]
MLKLYNTLTKQKEEFKPLHKGKASIYTCGPTVYDFAHIGNLRAYTAADTLRRYLEYLGYEVRQIKNITDAGHLTEDDIAQADTGEDKMLKAVRREKKPAEEIARFYEKAFRHDEKELNILPAHYFPRVTAHIPQMIKMIETLIEKGHAYEKNGNVFYDVTSFKDYGKLSGNTLENLKVGARLEEHPDKKHPWDFALWLKADPNHILQWDSPWSRGYPGWHIECSAMSIEYLGDTLDIHTGGEDHIFPHHEAEIAQSEGTTGKKFSNFWLHNRFLLVDGQKMSKSKGNYYILENITEKGFDPMHLRLFYLSSHYRKQADFPWPALEQAKANFEKISEWRSKLQQIANRRGLTSTAVEVKPLLIKFESAMDDDLNTPLALTYLYELITETNKKISENKLTAEEAKEILSAFEKMNKVFGLKFPEEETKIPKEVKNLADARLEARKNKDFQKADELREEIEKNGFEIEDLGEGYKLKKK